MLPTCWPEKSDPKTLFCCKFACEVDELFKALWVESGVAEALHKQRNDSNFVIGNWVASRDELPQDQYTWPEPESNGTLPSFKLRHRKIRFETPPSALASKPFSNEEQHCCSWYLPGKGYTVEAVSSTTAPYGDKFTIFFRYCMCAAPDQQTYLLVLFHVEILPTMNRMLKPVVSKAIDSNVRSTLNIYKSIIESKYPKTDVGDKEVLDACKALQEDSASRLEPEGVAFAPPASPLAIEKEVFQPGTVSKDLFPGPVAPATPTTRRIPGLRFYGPRSRLHGGGWLESISGSMVVEDQQDAVLTDLIGTGLRRAMESPTTTHLLALGLTLWLVSIIISFTNGVTRLCGRTTPFWAGMPPCLLVRFVDFPDSTMQVAVSLALVASVKWGLTVGFEWLVKRVAPSAAGSSPASSTSTLSSTILAATKAAGVAAGAVAAITAAGASTEISPALEAEEKVCETSLGGSGGAGSDGGDGNVGSSHRLGALLLKLGEKAAASSSPSDSRSVAPGEGNHAKPFGSGLTLANFFGMMTPGHSVSTQPSNSPGSRNNQPNGGDHLTAKPMRSAPPAKPFPNFPPPSLSKPTSGSAGRLETAPLKDEPRASVVVGESSAVSFAKGTTILSAEATSENPSSQKEEAGSKPSTGITSIQDPSSTAQAAKVGDCSWPSPTSSATSHSTTSDDGAKDSLVAGYQMPTGAETASGSKASSRSSSTKAEVASTSHTTPASSAKRAFFGGNAKAGLSPSLDLSTAKAANSADDFSSSTGSNTASSSQRDSMSVSASASGSNPRETESSRVAQSNSVGYRMSNKPPHAKPPSSKGGDTSAALAGSAANDIAASFSGTEAAASSLSLPVSPEPKPASEKYVSSGGREGDAPALASQAREGGGHSIRWSASGNCAAEAGPPSVSAGSGILKAFKKSATTSLIPTAPLLPMLGPTTLPPGTSASPKKAAVSSGSVSGGYVGGDVTKNLRNGSFTDFLFKGSATSLSLGTPVPACSGIPAKEGKDRGLGWEESAAVGAGAGADVAVSTVSDGKDEGKPGRDGQEEEEIPTRQAMEATSVFSNLISVGFVSKLLSKDPGDGAARGVPHPPMGGGNPIPIPARDAEDLPRKLELGLLPDLQSHKRLLEAGSLAAGSASLVVPEQVVVTEEVFENERFQPFRGWGHSWPGHFLPSDRVGRWGDRGGKPGGPASMVFEEVEPKLPKGWKWVEDLWELDMRGHDVEAVDADGWTYALDFYLLRFPPPPHSGRGSSMGVFVRRRRYTRTRVRIVPRGLEALVDRHLHRHLRSGFADEGEATRSFFEKDTLDLDGEPTSEEKGKEEETPQMGAIPVVEMGVETPTLNPPSPRVVVDTSPGHWGHDHDLQGRPAEAAAAVAAEAENQTTMPGHEEGGRVLDAMAPEEQRQRRTKDGEGGEFQDASSSFPLLVAMPDDAHQGHTSRDVSAVAAVGGDLATKEGAATLQVAGEAQVRDAAGDVAGDVALMHGGLSTEKDGWSGTPAPAAAEGLTSATSPHSPSRRHAQELTQDGLPSPLPQTPAQARAGPGRGEGQAVGRSDVDLELEVSSTETSAVTLVPAPSPATPFVGRLGHSPAIDADVLKSLYAELGIEDDFMGPNLDGSQNGAEGPLRSLDSDLDYEFLKGMDIEVDDVRPAISGRMLGHFARPDGALSDDGMSTTPRGLSFEGGALEAPFPPTHYYATPPPPDVPAEVGGVPDALPAPDAS